ncbi:hypothetical protein LCGC14_0811600 [marine sediment metagenome]|uniref:Uncharacterized protein n=1 Tax=marine sediment metagenome TaxID=412755 RepID=A0A0F9STY0_9ZZZZ
MSNELARIEDLENLDIDKHTEEEWDAAASSNAFLPRLQLLTSNSAKCKSGEFSTNHYALIQDQKFDDLGKNIDVLLITWQPKALETGDAIISSYDPNSDEFQRIQKKASERDSGCMYGPEFLVWIPAIKRFATFFMGTKTARRESGNVKALLKKAASLTSQECKNKKYTWYAPQVSECSTPFDMPNKDELLEACEQFNNPPKSDIEGVSEEEETRAR